MCDCPTCQRSRRIESIKLGGNVEEMRNLIEELHGMILHLEMDNDHYAAVFSGEWPSSEALLSEALLKVSIKKMCDG
jgi:hypothetical protein